MIRNLIFLSLLVASFAVPYFLFSENGRALLQRWRQRGESAAEVEAEPSYKYTSSVASSPAVGTIGLPLKMTPIHRMEEALNFSVTPPWVLGNWPHVTRGLVNGQLVGYRVPLVTGTAENDVTGSLTYYFGQDQLLRQITLEGDTGDGRRLVDWVTNQFGLTRQMTPDPGQYVYRSAEQGQVLSELRLRPESFIRTSAPLQRFQISMVLNRPGSGSPQQDGSFQWSNPFAGWFGSAKSP